MPKEVETKMTLGQKLSLVGISAVAFSSSAFAAGVLTQAPTFDTSDINLIAGALIAALAVIWGVKKAIGLLSRG
ncbi:MAG: hypothetical protein ACTTJS_05700 [Wolinella sp.]